MVCSQWPAPAEAMDLRQMPYSRMVLQETLRIRPSSWLVPRTAVADDEIDTYHIPAGAMLLSLAFAGPLLVGACLVADWQARQLPIIAYVMTRAEWKQRGVGRQMLWAVLQTLREQGYHRVGAVITEGNIPSEQLLGRMGFQKVSNV